MILEVDWRIIGIAHYALYKSTYLLYLLYFTEDSIIACDMPVRPTLKSTHAKHSCFCNRSRLSLFCSRLGYLYISSVLLNSSSHECMTAQLYLIYIFLKKITLVIHRLSCTTQLYLASRSILLMSLISQISPCIYFIILFVI